MRISFGALALIAVAAWSSFAAAETLRAGMSLPQITLTDQHDVSATIPTDARFVLYTRDMDGAGIVKDGLEDNGAALLEAARAVTVSDISRMPGVITRLFALPAMRKRPYRMLLDREGTATADFPAEEDEVTVLILDQGRIERVDYLGSPEALRSLLQAAAPK